MKRQTTLSDSEISLLDYIRIIYGCQMRWMCRKLKCDIFKLAIPFLGIKMLFVADTIYMKQSLFLMIKAK